MAFALEGPALIEVEQGKSATATIRVLATSRPYRNVSLSVSGVPSHLTVLFSPTSGKPTFQSRLTVTAAQTGPIGDFTVTVRARDAKGSKTMPIVFRNTPGPNIPPPSSGGGELNGLGLPIGYGRNATGGFGGSNYVVTSLSGGTGAGTLRDACSVGNRWITFSPGLSGTISLGAALQPQSNTTIDGRGANITIGTVSTYVGYWGGSGPARSNMIFHNLKFDTASGAELVVGRNGSLVWVDHCSFFLVEAPGDIEGFVFSTDLSNLEAPYDVTLSWCKFVDPDSGADGMGSSHGAFLGSVDPSISSNSVGTLTAHHNWFYKVGVRQPLYRHQTYHFFNNWHDEGEICVQAAVNASYRSDNEIFKRPTGSTYKRIYNNPPPGSEGNSTSIAVSGIYLVRGDEVYDTFNPGSIFTPPYSYTLETANDALIAAIEAGAGWH